MSIWNANWQILPRSRFCEGEGGDLPYWRISKCQYETLTSTNLNSNSIWIFFQNIVRRWFDLSFINAPFSRRHLCIQKFQVTFLTLSGQEGQRRSWPEPENILPAGTLFWRTRSRYSKLGAPGLSPSVLHPFCIVVYVRGVTLSSPNQDKNARAQASVRRSRYQHFFFLSWLPKRTHNPRVQATKGWIRQITDVPVLTAVVSWGLTGQGRRLGFTDWSILEEFHNITRLEHAFWKTLGVGCTPVVTWFFFM
jgi:hypothetical protein